MALFSTRSQEPVKETKEKQTTLDDVLDEVTDLLEVINTQTKLIKEMMAELQTIKLQQEKLEIKINESIRKDEELHDVKTKLFNMIGWIQDQFVCMLIHTKEKAAEPKVSPAVKAYLDKKSTNGTKLPLP